MMPTCREAGQRKATGSDYAGEYPGAPSTLHGALLQAIQIETLWVDVWSLSRST